MMCTRGLLWRHWLLGFTRTRRRPRVRPQFRVPISIVRCVRACAPVYARLVECACIGMGASPTRASRLWLGSRACLHSPRIDKCCRCQFGCAGVPKGPLVLPAAFKDKPPTLACHMCGREFGTASLQIHFKSCARKWERKQAELPAVRARVCVCACVCVYVSA